MNPFNLPPTTVLLRKPHKIMTPPVDTTGAAEAAIFMMACTLVTMHDFLENTKLVGCRLVQQFYEQLKNMMIELFPSFIRGFLICLPVVFYSRLTILLLLGHFVLVVMAHGNADWHRILLVATHVAVTHAEKCQVVVPGLLGCQKV